ncbi:MAG TPA: hypothetical protein VIU39_15520, partial [Anaerolineales bacterium]
MAHEIGSLLRGRETSSDLAAGEIGGSQISRRRQENPRRGRGFFGAQARSDTVYSPTASSDSSAGRGS